MNIQPTSQYNVSMYGAPGSNSSGYWNALKNFAQKIVDKIPEKTFKSNKELTDKLRNYDTRLSKPAENRIIMGATALATQPAIDYYNNRVDDNTRIVSRNRTIAKIIAGTFVGCIVRSLCYNAIDRTTLLDGKTKYSKMFLPKKYENEFRKFPKKMKNYKNAISTIVALGVMSITNFLLDAPLTLILTNMLNSKTMDPQKTKQQNLKEGIYG